jgi:peptidoglycan/LPS O-acetylase OafA/YrhL
MSSEIPSNSRRLSFLDSLRALAALFVVMHHAIINYYDHVGKNFTKLTDFDLHGVKLLVVRIFFQGHWSVDLFIVLSGFSLMLSVLKSDYQLKGGLLLFFKRRIIRIIPTYYAAIVLSLILIATLIGDRTQTHWDMSIPIDNIDVITHFLLISDFFNSTAFSISHVFWSICVEFRIYLFFPILLWFWRKKGAVSAIFVSVLVSVIGLFLLGVLKAFVTDDINTITSGVSPYIILFTLGMLAADLSFKSGEAEDRIRSFYRNWTFTSLTAGVLIVATMLVFAKLLSNFHSNGFIETKVLHDHLTDIAIGLFCSLFLFAVSLLANEKNPESLTLVILNWKPLAFIGTFSYSLYLIHPVVLQLVSKFIIIPLHTDRFTGALMLAFIGTGASLIFSYVFFLGFELPLMKLGKSARLKAITQKISIQTAG